MLITLGRLIKPKGAVYIIPMCGALYTDRYIRYGVEDVVLIFILAPNELVYDKAKTNAPTLG